MTEHKKRRRRHHTRAYLPHAYFGGLYGGYIGVCGTCNGTGADPTCAGSHSGPACDCPSCGGVAASVAEGVTDTIDPGAGAQGATT